MGAFPLVSRERARWEATSEYSKGLGEVIESINKAVHEAPFIVDEPKSKLGAGYQAIMHMNFDGESRWFVRFGEPLVFRAHWPKKNQEMIFLENYEGPYVEDFEITYDGLSFVATTQCQKALPPSYSFHFGREAKRILEQMIPELEICQPIHAGPAAIHPMVYVLVAEEAPALPLGRELIKEWLTQESVSIFEPKQWEKLGGITEAAKTLTVPLMSLTRALISSRNLSHHQAGVWREHANCAAAYRVISEPLPMKPFDWPRRVEGRIGASRTLRRSVASAYGHYVEAEDTRSDLRKTLQTVKEQFSTHPLLEGHADYPEDEVQEEMDWQASHILEGLRFFSEEARSRSLESVTFVAALAGGSFALIGAVVGYLLAG